jgi:hypothetical protein
MRIPYKGTWAIPNKSFVGDKNQVEGEVRYKPLKPDE